MLLTLLLLACTTTDSGEKELAAPTIAWLDPADGASVTAGDVAASLVVENFSLEDPAKHNDGTPIGYISVAVDEVEVLTTGSTTFTLSLTAGMHMLHAQLYFSDGDEVTANAESLCDEDGDQTGCEIVMAMASVTAD